MEAREAREGLADTPRLGPESADWMEVIEGLGARRPAAVREAPTGGVGGGPWLGAGVARGWEGPGSASAICLVCGEDGGGVKVQLT